MVSAKVCLVFLICAVVATDAVQKERKTARASMRPAAKGASDHALSRIVGDLKEASRNGDMEQYVVDKCQEICDFNDEYEYQYDEIEDDESEYTNGYEDKKRSSKKSGKKDRKAKSNKRSGAKDVKKAKSG